MIMITKRARILAIALALIMSATMVPVLSDVGNVYATNSGYETESNDNYDEADAVTVNQTYYGNLDDGSDDDYFWFETDSAGTITLVFGHEDVNSPSSYWDVSLIGKDKNTIISKEITGNSGTVTFTTVGLPAGTYYIKVDNSWLEESAAQYNFTARFAPSTVWETEKNNNYDAADPVAVNNTYYGNLMSGGSHDYYWFRTTEPGVITLTFNHDYVNNPSSYWNVTLINEDKNTLISGEIAGNQTTTTFTKIGVPAGNYYIHIDNTWIENSPANYNFKATFTPSSVWETEMNDNKSDSDAVSVGTSYYGNLDSDGDDDFYWFRLSRKTKIKVDFSHANLNSAQDYWNVTLIDKASGNTIVTEKVKGNKTNVSLNAGYLESGDYYLQIDTDWLNNWSNTDYSFAVLVNKNPDNTKFASIKAGKRSATLKWKKSSDANGYEIYRATKKNGKYKKIKTIKKKNTVTFKNKKLKKNKKYFYKIRAYRIVGGQKYYSKYSAVKVVKAR